jgi:hypothetical protein
MFARYEVTLARFAAASENLAKHLLLQLRGLGVEGSNTSAEPVDDAPFWTQFGVAIKPVVARSLRALGWRHGRELWVLKVWDQSKIPTDLASGETRTYAVGKNTVRIRHNATGSLDIESDGGNINITASASESVIVNGGSLPVARQGDAVSVSVTSVEAALILAPPGGGPCTVAGPVTVNGSIGTPGQNRFKA